MLRGHLKTIVLTLVVCALCSTTVLAKKHQKKQPHKPKSKTSAGTLTVGSSYQGTNTVVLGTLIPSADPYQGLIIGSGYGTLVASPPQTFVLEPLSPSVSTISYGGTVTFNNSASLVSSGAIISTGTLNLSPSAGVLSVDLGNTSISSGTLLLNNSTNQYGSVVALAPTYGELWSNITLSGFSNYVIPTESTIVSSGTLTLNAPEPTCLGLAALASLGFLRRPSRN